MQGMGNQSDTQDQLKDDGETGRQKREVETKEMIAVNVNLESVHVDNLQDGRHDEHQTQQDLQCRFTKGMGQSQRLWFVIVVVDAEQLLPPAGVLARHLVLRDFVADHLSPTLDFLGFVGTGRIVLNGVILLTQVHHFLVLDGGATAIARLLARRQGQNRQGEQDE